MRFSSSRIVRHLGLRCLIQFVIHFPRFMKLFSRLVKDTRVPLKPKLVLLAVLIYLVLPTDLLPDFILGLGQVDDLMAIFMGLNLFLRLCPKEIVQEHVHAIAAGG